MMGDRTYCTLQVCGNIAATAIEGLADAIRDQNGTDLRATPAVCTNENENENDADEVAQAFAQVKQRTSGEPPWFGFEEMNYGLIPDQLAHALKIAGASWSWTWHNGEDYSAGIAMHNANAPIGHRDAKFPTFGDSIALTLTDAKKPEAVEEAERWWNWHRTRELTIQPSDQG